MAVDEYGDALTFDGSPWSAPNNVDGDNSFSSVSRISGSSCVAVDYSGNALTYDGTSWSTPADIDGGLSLSSVSCAGPSACLALDYSGNVLTSTARGQAQLRPRAPTIPSLLSCARPSSCMAVDYSGFAFNYTGGTWSAPAQIDSSGDLSSVSCARSSFCVAVDYSGNALTYDGTSWSAPADIDGYQALASVSSASSSFCVAVDYSGNALTYDGSSWSAPADIDGAGVLTAVSCTISSYCVAVDHSGKALTYDGSSWTTPVDIDSSGGLDSLSRVSASFCAAADWHGDALTYEGAVPSSQYTWGGTGCLPLLLSDGSYDYIYGPGTTPVEEVSLATSTPTYMTYVADDATWVTSNLAGAQTGFWGYDAFGSLAFGTPASAFGYAGQYTDAITGLSDMRARWYDPGTGEFTSVDPDLAATDQPYVYAGDDPVNEGDPTGTVCSNSAESAFEGRNAFVPTYASRIFFFPRQPKAQPFTTRGKSGCPSTDRGRCPTGGVRLNNSMPSTRCAEPRACAERHSPMISSTREPA